MQGAWQKIEVGDNFAAEDEIAQNCRIFTDEPLFLIIFDVYPKCKK